MLLGITSNDPQSLLKHCYFSVSDTVLARLISSHSLNTVSVTVLARLIPSNFQNTVSVTVTVIDPQQNLERC